MSPDAISLCFAATAAISSWAITLWVAEAFDRRRARLKGRSHGR